MDFVTKVTLLAGVGVLAVQQILKIMPLSVTDFANKYPVPTNIALSLGAAIFAVWQDFVQPVVWTDWVALVAIIAGTAAVIYNQLIGRWAELKRLETTAETKKL